MRAVSLLPSATELLYALGVVPAGVSHSCDFPPAARERPTLTGTAIDHGDDRSAADIDRQTRDVEGSVYDVDEALLADLAPDVVVTQATCEVCAVDASDVFAAVDDLRGREGWAELTAVREGEVYAVDGDGYVNRPGPRLVDSLELLAACVHPDRFDAPAPEAVRRVGPAARP